MGLGSAVLVSVEREIEFLVTRDISVNLPSDLHMRAMTQMSSHHINEALIIIITMIIIKYS